jgi:tRNA A37 N6-isopentenylltransferase MiaA
MIEEVHGLQYLGQKRLYDLGLELRYTDMYLRGDFGSKDEYISVLHKQSWQYAKRQLTWLKKQDITWIKQLDEILALL